MIDITKVLKRNLAQLERTKQQAIRGMLKTLKQIEQEKTKRTADLEQAARIIKRELADLGWKGNGSTTPRKPAAPAAPAVGRPRRIRRTPEQLKTEAGKVLAMIRSAGKDGIGGGEIRKKFAGVGPNIKQFVEQHAGEKVKSTGQKARMRYHVP